MRTAPRRPIARSWLGLFNKCFREEATPASFIERSEECVAPIVSPPQKNSSQDGWITTSALTRARDSLDSAVTTGDGPGHRKTDSLIRLSYCFSLLRKVHCQ